jgi:antitoxin component of MazEF toxin-antitoxin module
MAYFIYYLWLQDSRGVDMSQLYKNIGKIKEVITLQVSARGNGLCLYLPKQLCETYGIHAGHRLKVVIRDHFQPVPSDFSAGPSHTLDKVYNKGLKKRPRESEEVTV